ncbi:Sulfotransferase domain-containing protein [Sinomicrobium oceani]|uniref:Sulfotransferase domain-containing protein n=1 Tax=Sinomicrobium oceani TaxID=1150368 RepID=A0A1K1QZZ2_9FLAO|nr:sulfotransferase [Sinomicrobium oceani]SFW65233.1 Sulfotransferase domain-containing protein [Sinomicrobium oceani]
MKNPPIIIIGAGRSGTNILRDSICSIQGFETWPCDEINYIWRHGNIAKNTDRFTAGDARPGVRKYIKGAFESFERKSKAEHVVEKTCASSLKVPFIEAIFPNAKYIFLIRDGRDVASSAKQRWTASLELKYIWKKVKYVPVSDIPYYGFRYFINRIKKLFSSEKRLAFWGPIYPGMKEDLQKDSLIEVCGKQWATCVEAAYEDLLQIDSHRVHMMNYETFVGNPVEEMGKVMDFIGLEASEKEIKGSVNKVSTRSIGNYKKYITPDDLEKLNRIVEPIMVDIYHKIEK